MDIFKDYNKIKNEIMQSIVYDEKTSVIYHYTSPEGLMGILGNCNLWFTRMDYLNDRTELIHIYSVLKKMINEDNSFPDLFKEVISQKNFAYDYRFKETYICSFSLKNDELSLWNYYTKSESKSGYSIGFKCDFLFGDFLDTITIYKSCVIPIFGRVIYSENEQKKILRKLLSSLSKIYEDNPCESDSIMNLFFQALIELAPFFKHPAFKNEEEIRMVLICLRASSENLKDIYKMTIKNGIFIPHYEIPFKPVAIESITYSPYIKTEYVGKSVLDLLTYCNDLLTCKYSLDKIAIKKSEIPVEY